MRRILVCWAALVALLAVELVSARLGQPVVVGLLAIIMVLLVALGFMELRRAPPLATIFALGGVLWLVILLVLGSMDSFTRTDYPVALSSVR